MVLAMNNRVVRVMFVFGALAWALACGAVMEESDDGVALEAASAERWTPEAECRNGNEAKGGCWSSAPLYATFNGEEAVLVARFSFKCWLDGREHFYVYTRARKGSLAPEKETHISVAFGDGDVDELPMLGESAKVKGKFNLRDYYLYVDGEATERVSEALFSSDRVRVLMPARKSDEPFWMVGGTSGAKEGVAATREACAALVD